LILKSKNNIDKKLISYLKLFISICILCSFVFYIAPAMDDVPEVAPLVNFIDHRGINAGALYYTDIQEFCTAEINMINTMNYSPRRDLLLKQKK
jgi:hypothetical protein